MDNLGRLTSLDWQSVGAIPATLHQYGYTYDGFGRRTALSLADGSIWNYTYDDMGQLTDAKHLLSAIPGGPPAEYASGDLFEYAYDDIGNRTSIGEGGDASAGDVYQSAYQSNELNQYTQRQVSGNIEINGNSTSAGMLVGVQEEGQSPDVFAPTRHGDFFHRRAGPVDNTTNAWLGSVLISELPPPSLNEFSYQMFLPASPELFSYDEDGNLTQDGIWNYQWDAENRLKAMWMRTEIAELRWASGNEAWVRLEFAYDWMGRRISKKFLKSGTSPSEVKDKGTETIVWGASHWTKYIYDGAAGSGGGSAWHLMASYSSSLTDGAYLGPDQSFAWGPDLSGMPGGAGGIGGLAVYSDDAPSGGGSPIWGMFPTFDPQGNIEAVYDSTAATQVAGYEYGPFGETRSVSGTQGQRNPFRWSSKFTDGETGLVYYGYRYYAAGVGRWISRDPIAEHGGFALYQADSGIRTIDPLGLARRSQVESKQLEYSCNCGWIDWHHADPGDPLDAFNPMLQLLQTIANQSGKRSTSRSGFLAHVPGQFIGGIAGIPIYSSPTNMFVRYGLVGQDVFSATLTVLDVVWNTEERDQWPAASSYSAEDLPSDLIAYYRLIRDYSADDIRRMCWTVGLWESLSTWDHGGRPSHGTPNKWADNHYLPEDFNGTQQACPSSLCRNGPAVWPQQLKTIPKFEVGVVSPGLSVPDVDTWRINWQPFPVGPPGALFDEVRYSSPQPFQ